MKQGDLADAQETARLIEIGTATRRDWVALLIYIRSGVPDGMIKDLGHFVAHTTRNRGDSYVFLEGFAQRMLDGFLAGLRVEPIPLFVTTSLIDELCDKVSKLGIRLDPIKVTEHRGHPVLGLADVLNGSSVKLRNPYIERCSLQMGQVSNLDGSGSEELMCVFKIKGLPTLSARFPKSTIAIKAFG